MRLFSWLTVGFFLLVAPASNAQSPKSKALAEQLEKLIEDHRQANNPHLDALREAKTADERDVIRAAQTRLARSYSSKIMTVAEKAGKTATAAQALGWIMKYDPNGAIANKAMDLLVKNFLHSPLLVPILTSLKPENTGIEKLLKPASEKSKYAECQAAALLTWAEILQARAEQAEKFEDATKLLKEAEQKVTTLLNRYGFIANGQYIRRARDVQYELQNLSVGKTAPDISGNDLDEQPFKLKDYRGKVIVLLFWNSKHPKHSQSFGEARQILTKHAGQSIVVLGINGEDAKYAKEYLETSRVTWRTWHDDGRRIGRDWRSDGNTLYVIDGKGVIRGRNVHEQKLSALVDSLLKE